MTLRFLVTGGAGFVGSHLVAHLLDTGCEVTVFDNLRTGHVEAVLPGARFVHGDLADAAAVDAVLKQGAWDAVFHFAALSLVGESMRIPLRYISENLAGGLNLIEACVRHGVRRFVLSSTAALFGGLHNDPIPETAAIAPGSPYGESKLMLERALYWASEIHGLRSACLRYFNAAGSDPAGRLGEDHVPETHLIPLVIDAALGRRPPLQVFGADYPTLDGTCIRDYIHVSDLALAHVRVLDILQHRSTAYNLGTGKGHSVLEVIQSVQRVSGKPVPYTVTDRRPGDPAMLVAASGLITAQTGWQPRFTALDDIVGTAHAWRIAHPNGYR